MSSYAKPLPITAWSAVNGLGRSTAEVLSSLDAGRSGLVRPPFELPIETVVGAVPGELAPLADEWRAYDCRLSRMAALALDEVRDALGRAVTRWGKDRVAIVLGTSTGGLHATERAYFAWRTDGRVPDDYDYHRQHDFNALGELVARMISADGPVYTVSTACSSSGKTHACAQRLIASDLADAVLVGGVDSLCRMTLQGFFGLGVLSSKPCRPFGAGRDGINIGEGAAFQLLEREGESDVWLLGVGESSDAHHMSSPHPEGRGAAEAMQRAMEQAGVGVDDIDHLNAHGTSTLLNDQAESIAIHALFGDRLPVVSTKGYTGHLLGAAAATEAVFAIHAVLTGALPATLGADPKDPAIACDVVLTPRRTRVRRALSNSFAFGGSNVSLLVGGPP
jgi:3-oxoacyl-[acyl-carrier-protein] synthase-1